MHEVKLKILVAHNFYNSKIPSGENVVYEAECQLLRQKGHEVETFNRHSDVILRQGFYGKIKGGISTPWNFSSAKSISGHVSSFKPDVVHVHNTFPLISPSIFHAIGKRAVKVLTLHNYRLVCPAGLPMHDGQICIKCINRRSVLPSLIHTCYRNSLLATIPVAISVALHRSIGTWANNVDAFIALTNFQKEVLINSGLPERKIHVKPNFYPGQPEVVNWNKRDNSVVFVGRLSFEKGVDQLISAWQHLGLSAPELKIIGEGPLRSDLEVTAKGLNIKFFGHLPSAEAQSHIANAKLLIIPSKGFEGFPMVIREAFAFGTPVISSNVGPLPSIIKDNITGRIFPVNNIDALASLVIELWNDSELIQQISRNARMEFEQLYTDEANYKILLDIYNSAFRVGETH